LRVLHYLMNRVNHFACVGNIQVFEYPAEGHGRVRRRDNADGAWRDSSPSWGTIAQISVAMLQREEASSMTINRPVFSTLSRIVSMSSGEIIPESTISPPTPSDDNLLAAS